VAMYVIATLGGVGSAPMPSPVPAPVIAQTEGSGLAKGGGAPVLQATAKTFEWVVVTQSPKEFAAAWDNKFVAVASRNGGEVRTEPKFVLAIRTGDAARMAELKVRQAFEPLRGPTTMMRGQGPALAPEKPEADWTWLGVPDANGASMTQAHVTIGGEFPVTNHEGKAYFTVKLVDGGAEQITVELTDQDDSKRVDLQRDHPVYVAAGGAFCALVFPTVYASEDAESQIPKDRATIIIAAME
jgi:hypothetical protein